MNQEPLPMESCEPLAALNVLLWPVVSPKNRVGGSPGFSFVFAFQYIGETLDTPAENGGCGYDFASGVHKYLYAQDDPVDNDDPDGHDIGDMLAAMDISAGLDGFALPVFASATTPIANTGKGFAYDFWAEKWVKRLRHHQLWDHKMEIEKGKTIVENAAGVSKMKSDIAEVKAHGYKFSKLKFYGHGDAQVDLGADTCAAIQWRAVLPSGDNNVLNRPDIINLFNGLLMQNAEVDMEFCHSLDYNDVPKMWRSMAPQADIWGVYGEKIGYGDYGFIYPPFLRHYDQ